MSFKTTSQRLHEMVTASRVQQLTPIAAVAVTALIGGALLFSTRAAGTFLAAEPEQGTLTSTATSVADTTASGGSAIKFGNGLKYITGISSNGRYFVDQGGQPIPVWGDSPISLMTRIDPTDAQFYLDNRKTYGVNAIRFQMIGSATGGYADSGRTFDNILPFTGGNLNTPNAAYWSRVDNYLGMMRDRGMTALAFPIDSWNSIPAGTVFAGKSLTDLYNYGAFLGNRYKDYPNILWVYGADYFPTPTTATPWLGTDSDFKFDAVMRGIQSTGDNRPVTIELGYDKSLSTDNPYWESRVDWNWAYTYPVSYKAVFDGYNKVPSANEQPGTRNPRPVLFADGNYEGGLSAPAPYGTAAELRRQMLWALTAGSPGAVTGQESVWDVQADWKTKLSSTTTTQIHKIRTYFSGLNWSALVANKQAEFVTVGRTTRVTADDPPVYAFDNKYTTASVSADGKLAMVYVPEARTITLNTAMLAAGVTAKWIDPTNATGTAATATINSSGQVTTPTAAHSDGYSDWLLVIK